MTGRSLSARGLFGDLPPSAWEQLEKVLERFEDSWRRRAAEPGRLSQRHRRGPASAAR